MTQREFFNEIIKANINEEVNEFAIAAIEKLDKANERHKIKRAEKKEEDLPLINAVKETLTNEPKTAKEIGEIVGVNFQKVTPILTALIGEGFAAGTEIKVKGKGKTNAYIVAT